MSYTFYIKRESFFHKLSPTTKIIVSLILATLPWFVTNVYFNFTLFIIALILLIIAKVSWSSIRMYWQVFLLIITILTLTWLIFFRMPGPVLIHVTLFQIGKFKLDYLLTYTQLVTWATMVLRIITMAMATLLLLTTTTQRELIYGLRQLKVPYTLCLILALTFRFIPLAFGDLETILAAQKCRGLKLAKVNVFKRVIHIARAFVPLIAISLSRIETMSNALDARGFRLGVKRRSYLRVSFSYRDYIMYSVTIALVIVIVLLKILKMG